MSEEISFRGVTPDELETLYQERGPGFTDVELQSSKEPLGKLEVAPNVFQYRDTERRPWKRKNHVRNLAGVVESQDKLLDPILLFPIAGHRVVIDGHCRLEAYHQAGLEESQPVPVEYYRGDFAEAVAKAAAANSKDKLPLTQEEKLEAAWQLVKFDESRHCYSLRDVARSTGVGKSTVGNMRKALQRDDLDFDPRDETWKNFKRMRRGECTFDEEWEEKLAHIWARRMRDGLGDKPSKSPTCLFRALEIAYPQVVPSAVPYAWALESGFLDEARATRDELDDFDF